MCGKQIIIVISTSIITVSERIRLLCGDNVYDDGLDARFQREAFLRVRVVLLRHSVADKQLVRLRCPARQTHHLKLLVASQQSSNEISKEAA
ncbi:unnamed protein product [Gongylonema pulchrum]|uniref:AAA_12 domain-containing protein n=1 Tax=Gongylonema pulchrum TaxID=637853 RepID=A0A183DXM5_9BILA|nr:unnamed protein product [Gongylonema pulchrum]